MATAAKVTVAEVEELVEPGMLNPDHIATPGIFVQRIVKLDTVNKRIEKPITRMLVTTIPSKRKTSRRVTLTRWLDC
jgi:acyl CoA:acetate/3-ketoacid CoA transferase